MPLAADIAVVAVLFKGAAVLGFTAAALRLFWLAHVEHTPALAAARDALRAPYVSPFAKPLPAAVEPARLAAGAAADRLSHVLDQARDQVQSINAASVTAARQIAGAEAALNRLLADVTAVMPAVIAPTVVPRRSLSVSEPEAAAPANAQAA